MAAIFSSRPSNPDIIPSVTCISKAGHIPAADRTNVTIMAGIMIPVNGTAVRFVSMKYSGKLPK
jgi:hypothetical protein